MPLEQAELDPDEIGERASQVALDAILVQATRQDPFPDGMDEIGYGLGTRHDDGAAYTIRMQTT